MSLKVTVESDELSTEYLDTRQGLLWNWLYSRVNLAIFDRSQDLAQNLFEVCYRRLAHKFLEPGITLHALFERGLTLIEESPESVHFVMENLRRYWHALPADVRAHSLLGSMRRLIQAEQRAGRVRPDADPNLAAALVLGALGQIARMAHFKELSKPPSALATSLLNLINRGLGA